MNAPSYKTHDPKGWCGDPTRGAAMGRGAWLSDDKDAPHRLVLCEVEIDSGGYDRNGTYFGTGDTLYWFANEDSTIDAMLRSSSRKRAEDKIREMYPNAIVTIGATLAIPLCAECRDEEVGRDGDICDKCNDPD